MLSFVLEESETVSSLIAEETGRCLGARLGEMFRSGVGRDV